MTRAAEGFRTRRFSESSALVDALLYLDASGAGRSPEDWTGTSARDSYRTDPVRPDATGRRGCNERRADWPFAARCGDYNVIFLLAARTSSRYSRLGIGGKSTDDRREKSPVAVYFTRALRMRSRRTDTGSSSGSWGTSFPSKAFLMIAWRGSRDASRSPIKDAQIQRHGG